MARRILFDNIQNHNAHGYGVGSIERSIDVARTHLDFFAFTPGTRGGTTSSPWRAAARRTGGAASSGSRRRGPTSPTASRRRTGTASSRRSSASSGTRPRTATSAPCSPDDHRPLCRADSVDALRRFCLAERALIIHHHLAYPRGRRGVDWDVFDEAATPVVAIYSEHGNSEDDRGPYPMVTYSFGGRQIANSVRAALARGLRFGFVASSADHAGFPGAYGEGLMGALATDLTRPAILDAIRARRTYALTGDRIEVRFTVEGAPMGSTVRVGREVEVAWDVRGRDELDVVELVQDGVVVHYAGRSVLLGGDATADESWPAMCAAGIVGHVDVLKASHHGRKSGYYGPAVKAMAPWLTITSVAEPNMMPPRATGGTRSTRSPCGRPATSRSRSPTTGRCTTRRTSEAHWKPQAE
jgi:hypothetical protein